MEKNYPPFVSAIEQTDPKLFEVVTKISGMKTLATIRSAYN
ncbi:MAG: hypothetical protein ACPLRZ_08550 [Thermovenabulum sp.]